MATIAKMGQMFGVKMTYDSKHLKLLKQAPELVQQTYADAAVWWHTGILPEHFTRKAHGKYGYAERNRRYAASKSGNPDLVRSGSMKAELLAKAVAKKKGTGVELRMTARALNFVPNSANPLDTRVKRGDGKMYPNMKKEVVEITQQEEKEITNIVQLKLAALFSESSTEGKGLK